MVGNKGRPALVADILHREVLSMRTLSFPLPAIVMNYFSFFRLLCFTSRTFGILLRRRASTPGGASNLIALQGITSTSHALINHSVGGRMMDSNVSF